MQSSAIFPLFYLPPISYFTDIKAQNFHVLLEKQEHFPKQTFRNRTSISSPNGRLDLIIPVIKGSKGHTAIKDVRISNDVKWQRLHWLSLQNCYRSAAYFNYYEDYFAPFYEKNFLFLFDYNLELVELTLKLLKIQANFSFTENYTAGGEGTDFRNHYTKQNIHENQNKAYFQVFSDRNAFLPNLSIVDLLFNQGPQSMHYF